MINRRSFLGSLLFAPLGLAIGKANPSEPAIGKWAVPNSLIRYTKGSVGKIGGWQKRAKYRWIS